MNKISPSKYSFTDSDPRWAGWFEEEAARLRSFLGVEVLDIYHIGSTSVPGLAAKPTIDLLPVVRSISVMDDRTGELESAGYRAWGEYGLPGRRLFTKDSEGYRTHNLHFYQVGDPDIERHVAFRDFLRLNTDVRAEYETLKREVYSKHPADIEAYNHAKNEWIRRIERVALEWFRARR